MTKFRTFIASAALASTVATGFAFTAFGPGSDAHAGKGVTTMRYCCEG